MEEQMFKERAKTGDILIFRGFEFPARCQRLFTQAEYDHVALLIRIDGSLRVFESTSRDGVKLRYWYEFVHHHWNLLYDKMVYRRLLIDGGDGKEEIQEAIQKNIEAFVSDTQGKKYSINFCNVCCKIQPTKKEREQKWMEVKSFFCSQLLAGAYLKSGITSFEYKTTSYLPGAFSVDKTLKFNKGYSLSPEYIIDFSK
jgi:hypothetical protein